MIERRDQRFARVERLLDYATTIVNRLYVQMDIDGNHPSIASYIPYRPCIYLSSAEIPLCICSGV